MRYHLYNGKAKVAIFDFEDGVISSYKPLLSALLPMQIVNASAEGFSGWLRERAIDLNTFQHRELMHTLFGSRDRIAVSIMTHMFSISDQLTCFPEGEYEDRTLLCSVDDQNTISDFILVSSDTSLCLRAFSTPNASTDGSFPKTWRFENGAWWLYKVQSVMATQSEHDISRVLEDCGFPAAHYAYDGRSRTRIKSLNFVPEDAFFEPYDSLRYMFKDKSDMDDIVYQNLRGLGETFERDFRRILLADALFMNTDRHTRNFGVLRSVLTGEILRMAPNFDNNQAYKASGSTSYSDAMLRDFKARYGFTERDRVDLEALTQACARYPFLSEAQSAGNRFLND